MADFIFEAETRTDLGKGASRRLRRTGAIPAVIYGGNQDAVSLTLDHNEVLKQFRSEAIYSHILTVKVNGKPEIAVLRDVQRHPYKPLITHLDFLRVNAKEIVRVAVPLHFINEDTAKGVKDQGGTVSHLLTTLEVDCLPKDLPEYIEVDLQAVEAGQVVHISEITLPAGVESWQLAQGFDEALVTIIQLRGGSQAGEAASSAE